ncbi:MAG: hypothetical protein QXX08_05365 [Candidatus Bathyarchaeia archaeon]
MSEIFSFPFNRLLRRKVAREAAILLYTSQEKEYKQAKERAANILGTSVLPTNREIAEELDRIADEREGLQRHDRLVRMRREALELMEALETFYPKLVGSVWRGTPYINSDIDITVFSSDVNQIFNRLQMKGFTISKVEFVTATRQGEKISSFHITVIFPSGDEAEIVVKDPEALHHEETCAIYGDRIKGLSIPELKKVLEKDPLQRFIPKKNFLVFSLI